MARFRSAGQQSEEKVTKDYGHVLACDCGNLSTPSGQPHRHAFERKLIQTDRQHRIPRSLHPCDEFPPNYGKLFEQSGSVASRAVKLFGHRRSRGIGPLSTWPYFTNHKRTHNATHKVNAESDLRLLSITVTFPYFLLWNAFHNKKNFLFVGHPGAGWRSAVIYSVLGTCALLSLNPWRYLTWALPGLAGATTKTAGDFTPHRFAHLRL